MAAHAHERPAAGRAPVVGRGGGHLVATQRRGGGGGHPPGEYAVTTGRCRLSAVPLTTRHAIALGQCLSPGLDHYSGGIAQSASSPPGPLRPGAVAAAGSISHTERNS